MDTKDQSFTLQDRFVLAHFDLKYARDANVNAKDAVTLEEVIHRAAVHAFSDKTSAEVKAVASAFLKQVADLSRKCLETVYAAVKEVDAQYKLDPLVGELPAAPPTTCHLRWNDERMWIMVRALVAIDTAHRQLLRLRERGAIDMDEVSRRRQKLIHPWRSTVAEIFRLSGALPREAKGRVQPVAVASAPAH